MRSIIFKRIIKLAKNIDFPFLKELSKLDQFNDRDKLLKSLENDKKLEFLGGGSSRDAYKIVDHPYVLKIAKNKKGLAQNKIESNPKIKSKFVNGAESSDENYYWLISNYADEIDEEKFKDIFKFSFKDYEKSLEYDIDDEGKKPKDFDEIKDTDLFKAIKKVQKDFDLIVPDLAKISSYGIIDGDIILIDAGYTNDISEKYYEQDNRQISETS